MINVPVRAALVYAGCFFVTSTCISLVYLRLELDGIHKMTQNWPDRHDRGGLRLDPLKLYEAWCGHGWLFCQLTCFAGWKRGQFPRVTAHTGDHIKCNEWYVVKTTLSVRVVLWDSSCLYLLLDKFWQYLFTVHTFVLVLFMAKIKVWLHRLLQVTLYLEKLPHASFHYSVTYKILIQNINVKRY